MRIFAITCCHCPLSSVNFPNIFSSDIKWPIGTKLGLNDAEGISVIRGVRLPCHQINMVVITINRTKG